MLIVSFSEGFASAHPENFSELTEYQFENAWRCSKWDLTGIELQSEDKDLGFHTSAFLCMKYF